MKLISTAITYVNVIFQYFDIFLALDKKFQLHFLRLRDISILPIFPTIASLIIAKLVGKFSETLFSICTPKGRILRGPVKISFMGRPFFLLFFPTWKTCLLFSEVWFWTSGLYYWHWWVNISLQTAQALGSSRQIWIIFWSFPSESEQVRTNFISTSFELQNIINIIKENYYILVILAHPVIPYIFIFIYYGDTNSQFLYLMARY